MQYQRTVRLACSKRRIASFNRSRSGSTCDLAPGVTSCGVACLDNYGATGLTDSVAGWARSSEAGEGEEDGGGGCDGGKAHCGGD